MTWDEWIRRPSVQEWAYDETEDSDVAEAVGEFERCLEDIVRGVEYPEMFAQKILSHVRTKFVPLRPVPIGDEELRIDHYENGRRHTVVVTHLPSGVVAEYESMLDRQDAETKARALLIVNLEKRAKEQSA